jgi:uncharacterized protein YjbI with pentapeptide repeats
MPRASSQARSRSLTSFLSGRRAGERRRGRLRGTPVGGVGSWAGSSQECALRGPCLSVSLRRVAGMTRRIDRVRGGFGRFAQRQALRVRGWPQTTRLVAGLVLAVVVVLLLPPLWVSLRGGSLTTVERLDAEGGVRSSVLQLLGGCLLLTGLLFTAQSVRLTREGHITDRYASAIEHLGHASVDVRIGGVFALERIHRDSQGDRQTVVEVLTAFVRTHTSNGPRAPLSDRVGPDVQAALTVLGRRLGVEDEPFALDLTHCGLTGAHLGGDFRRAQFHYSIVDQAVFSGGRFERAGLSFIKGHTVGFNHAQARGAHFVLSALTRSFFIGSDLRDCDFQGCDLSRSDIGRRYDDSGAPSPASWLEGARMSEANLTGTNFGGTNLSEVVGLTQDQVHSAVIDDNTLLPTGLVRPVPPVD